MKSLQLLGLLALFILATLPKNATARSGGQDGGGGDSYVQDFIHVADFEVLPWIQQRGKELYPAVDATAFGSAVKDLIAGKTIWSEEVVHESCNGSQIGRIVEACYNYVKNYIVLSRTRYPLEINNSAIKRRIVAHEIFRKMNLEGDDYALSNQLKFDDILPDPKNGPLNARCFLNYTDANGNTQTHFISSKGKSEGKLTSTPPDTEIELPIPEDFIAQLFTYSSDQLPCIYIVGYCARYETMAIIEPGRSTSISLVRGGTEADGPIRSLEADCELFQ